MISELFHDNCSSLFHLMHITFAAFTLHCILLLCGLCKSAALLQMLA